MLSPVNNELSTKIITFNKSDKILFNIVKEIRNSVFVKEQKVSDSDEFDSFESESRHYLIYEQEKAVGTARWRYVEDKIKLERFAILKEYRLKSYGNRLLERILEDVKELNKPIYLHAQSAVVLFYSKFEFEKEGNEFEECGILHYKMNWGSKK